MNGRTYEENMEDFTDWVLENVPEYIGNINLDKEKHRIYHIDGVDYGPIPVEKFVIFF